MSAMGFGRRKRGETANETMKDTSTEEGVAEGDEDVAVDAATTGEEVDELEATRRERDDLNDRLMRLQADFQNQRRHAQANIDAAVVRARSEVLGEAVTILDYLDMALATEVTGDEAKNLKVGVEMTRSQLVGLLERMNVSPIDTGGAFDPAVHQAVSTVETDEVEPGAIVDVVRSGWTMGEAVLRFAQVRVAAAPDGEGPTDDAGEEA